MKDFDPEYTSIPDYILKSTMRIWEERGIGRIRDYYSSDNIVRTAMGLTQGIDPVIAATNATLHQFPDRRLLGEDVIWTGDDETGPDRRLLGEDVIWTGDDETGQYYSSHRIVSPMHHTGDGLFVPPTAMPV